MAAPVLAAVSGKVVNQSTGKPQAGATVVLDKLDQNGPQPVGETKTDAQGRFSIDQSVEGPGMVRAEVDGVSYYKMIPPGSPTTGITLDVFNASREPGDAKVSKHMLLFEPGGGKVTVNESFIVENAGKTAWNDPKSGTVRFYLPKGAGGKADEIKATAPGGMPIDASMVKTAKPDEYGVDFAIKPGETRIDVKYTVPYQAGEAYAGKIASKDENTYLIAPNGITLKGENLSDLGTEPRTQAHIFGLSGASYNIELTGEEAAAPAADSTDQQDSGPQIEQIMPRVFGKAPLILALALGILALGFVLLYRAPASHPSRPEMARPGTPASHPNRPETGRPGTPAPTAKETNERGRR